MSYGRIDAVHYRDFARSHTASAEHEGDQRPKSPEPNDLSSRPRHRSLQICDLEPEVEIAVWALCQGAPRYVFEIFRVSCAEEGSAGLCLLKTSSPPMLFHGGTARAPLVTNNARLLARA